MADQQQHSAPRRLFQNFEQRVGAFAVEFVDRIHDRNPPSSLPGGRTEERYRPANVIDLDVLAQLVGLLVDRALQHQKVAVRLCRDAPGDRMIGIDVKRRRRLHRRRAWIGMGEDEARHAVGERRLADAGRPRDQPRVVEAPTPIGFEQRALGLGVAMKNGGLAWCPRLDAPRHRRRSRCGARALRRRARRIKSFAHDLPNPLGDRGLRFGCVDQQAAAGLIGCEPPVGVA